MLTSLFLYLLFFSIKEICGTADIVKMKQKMMILQHHQDLNYNPWKLEGELTTFRILLKTLETSIQARLNYFRTNMSTTKKDPPILYTNTFFSWTQSGLLRGLHFLIGQRFLFRVVLFSSPSLRASWATTVFNWTKLFVNGLGSTKDSREFTFSGSWGRFFSDWQRNCWC